MKHNEMAMHTEPCIVDQNGSLLGAVAATGFACGLSDHNANVWNNDCPSLGGCPRKLTSSK